MCPRLESPSLERPITDSEAVAHMKESLETMRDMVVSRIEMLQEGVTFYNEQKKAYYLQEYRTKLRELDQLILSLSLSLIRLGDGAD